MKKKVLVRKYAPIIGVILASASVVFMGLMVFSPIGGGTSKKEAVSTKGHTTSTSRATPNGTLVTAKFMFGVR